MVMIDFFLRKILHSIRQFLILHEQNAGYILPDSAVDLSLCEIPLGIVYFDVEVLIVLIRQ